MKTIFTLTVESKYLSLTFFHRFTHFVVSVSMKEILKKYFKIYIPGVDNFQCTKTCHEGVGEMHRNIRLKLFRDLVMYIRKLMLM